MHLLEVLALSGNHEAIISTRREEEEKLKGHTVFVPTLAIAKVYEQLQGIAHWGLAGPTKSGSLIVRTPSSSLEQVRRAVLAPTSPFADVLGMPINAKFVGKFPAKVGLQTAAASLRSSLGMGVRGVALQGSRQALCLAHLWCSRPTTLPVAL